MALTDELTNIHRHLEFMPEVFRYALVSVPAQLRAARVAELVKKAAAEWNRAMKGLVYIEHNHALANIFIEFGQVNRTKDAGRIAECQRHEIHGKPPYWRIILARDVAWSDARWYEFWRGGNESVLATITHEFGHVFLNDPEKPGWHSERAGDVMHTMCLNHLIAEDEVKMYRKRYREITHI